MTWRRTSPGRARASERMLWWRRGARVAPRGGARGGLDQCGPPRGSASGDRRGHARRKPRGPAGPRGRTRPRRRSGPGRVHPRGGRAAGPHGGGRLAPRPAPAGCPGRGGPRPPRLRPARGGMAHHRVDAGLSRQVRGRARIREATFSHDEAAAVALLTALHRAAAARRAPSPSDGARPSVGDSSDGTRRSPSPACDGRGRRRHPLGESRYVEVARLARRIAIASAAA